MPRSRSRFLAVGAATGAALFLAACGSGAVPAADVAQSIREQLASEFGYPIDEVPDVTCPGDLPVEVDASIRCTLSDLDGDYGVTVTVTSVDGGKAFYRIKVDDAPS